MSGKAIASIAIEPHDQNGKLRGMGEWNYRDGIVFADKRISAL
ncbi:hypothetical protein [Nitrosomonas ureae]|nr:hypothetical protein [Nitrosomonas ureae]